MAFNAGMIWDVRSGGSDSNSGGFDPTVAAPGTDFSQQNAAQIAYTDLVIDGTTNTKITSAAHPFDSTSPGNTINITGGTGFTVQTVEILSVSGNVATCDKAVGTTGSTGGTGNLGGAKATLGSAAKLTVGGNVIFLLGPATYSFTVTTRNANGGPINIPATPGGTNLKPTRLVGWVTNRTVGNLDPIGSLPVIQAASGIATGTYVYFNDQYVHTRNIVAKNPNNSAAGYNAFQLDNGLGLCERCTADNFANGIWSSFGVNDVIDCRATNSTEGILGSGSGGCIQFCTATGCTDHAYQISGNSNVTCCIAYSNPGYGFYSTGSAFFNNCTSRDNTTLKGYGFYMADGCVLVNCLAWNNAQNDYDNNIASWRARLFNCAGVTKGSNWSSQNTFGFISLSAYPNTNAAGGDFGLNNAVGGGALCRGAGYPASYFGLSTTSSYFDIGAAQHPDPPSGAVVIHRAVVVR